MLQELNEKLDGGEDLRVGSEVVGVRRAINDGVRASLVDEQVLEGDRGPDDVLSERFASLRDNHIHDGCEVYQGSSAIALLQSGGNRIAHNEIHGWFEWATSAGWQWDYWPPGRARDNLVWDFGSGGLGFNFSNTGNILTNNIVAFGRVIQLDRCGDQPWAGASVGQSGIVYRNIVIYAQGTMWRGEKWLNHDMLLDYNLYWHAKGEPLRFLAHDFSGWQALGHDAHSVVADPLFVAPERGDFRLSPDSPARAMGFRELDLSRAGPRPAAERD